MSKLSESTTKNSFAQALIIVIAMVIAISILNVAETSLRNAEIERAVSEARDKVILDVKLLQKASVPEVHLGSYFYSRLNQAALLFDDEKSDSRKIKTTFENVVKDWDRKPELFIFNFEQLHDFADIASQTDNLGFVTVKRSILRYFCLKSVSNLTNTLFSPMVRGDMNDFVERYLDKKISSNQSDYCRSALANFRPLTICNKDFFFAWLPMFKENWENSISRFSPVYADQFDQRRLNLTHFRAAVAILIKAEDFAWIRKNKFKDILKYNFALTGSDIELFAIDAHNNKKHLAQNRIIYDESKNRVVGNTNLLLEQEYRVQASRESDFKKEKFRFAKFVGFVAKLAWFCLGLFVIGKFILIKRKLKLSISLQLFLFITWMLFPAFYLGFSITERYVLEKQTASINYLKSGMEEMVRAFDNSILFYKTWASEVINSSLEKNQKLLNSNNLGFEEKNCKKLLKNIKVELLDNGIFSKNILMVDSSGNIISNLYGADSKEKKFFQNFFKAFYQPIFNEVSGEKNAATDKKSDLLVGVQADEVVEVARNLLSAYKISVMAMSIASLDKFQGFGEQAYIYHRFIGKAEKAKAMLQVGIDLPSIERLCMLDWSNRFEDKRFFNLRWIITKDLSASWFLRQPFWKAISYGKMGLLSPIYDCLPPRLLFYSQIGYNSQEPYTVQLTFAGKEYLMAGMPGKQMLEYQFAAMIPLDHHYARLAVFRRNLLLVMGAIFILCSLIGFWLASTFIKPLKELGTNAEKVIGGNFSARLQASSEDSEFVVLGNNFNQIVKRLDTGQTLQKFVSDGALEVIQGNSQTDSDFAALDAFSLFIRLDKFWDKTVHLSAKKAVSELNRFFSIICREASASGGDVNKFIGEKAMAVFLCANNESPKNAAVRVAHFAAKVREALVRESDFFADCRLRIGITYGRILSGVIGAKNTRLEQTVIGDPVNMASRLCTISSQNPVLINKEFADLINENNILTKEFQAVFHSKQEVKGKRKPVEIYCLKIV